MSNLAFAVVVMIFGAAAAVSGSYGYGETPTFWLVIAGGVIAGLSVPRRRRE